MLVSTSSVPVTLHTERQRPPYRSKWPSQRAPVKTYWFPLPQPVTRTTARKFDPTVGHRARCSLYALAILGNTPELRRSREDRTNSRSIMEMRSRTLPTTSSNS